MKKLLIFLAVVPILIGLPFKAMSQEVLMEDSDVVVYVDHEKQRFTNETIDVEKNIDIIVSQGQEGQPALAGQSAQAAAIKKDFNENNLVIEEQPLDPLTEPPVITNATIDMNVLDDANGIVNVNQAPGTFVNQGNAASFSSAESISGTGEGTILGAETGVEATNTGNTILGGQQILLDEFGNPIPILDEFGEPTGEYLTVDLGAVSTRNNLIDNALNNFQGILGVNQSAGNMNNQNNATALSVADDPVAVVAESDLLLVNSSSNAVYTVSVRNDMLTSNGLNQPAGFIGINQSAGDGNNQANTISAGISTGVSPYPPAATQPAVQ